METRSVKLWSLLPWICGAVLLAGPFMSASNALVFNRAVLLVAVLVATVACIAAARLFERGDSLFVTWSALTIGFLILTTRYIIRLLVTVQFMQMPVMFDRVLLIVHNIIMPVALWLFVRSWRKTGLASSMSRAAMAGWTLTGFAVAVVVGSVPLWQGLHNTEPAMLVSTLGDVLCIALIVPLLMPAFEMRGGLLMYTWLYLAISQVVWLMYDVWAVMRTTGIVAASWGLAIDQGLRVVALLYVYSASAAQRHALAQTREQVPRVVGPVQAPIMS